VSTSHCHVKMSSNCCNFGELDIAKRSVDYCAMKLLGISQGHSYCQAWPPNKVKPTLHCGINHILDDVVHGFIGLSSKVYYFSVSTKNR